MQGYKLKILIIVSIILFIYILSYLGIFELKLKQRYDAMMDYIENDVSLPMACFLMIIILILTNLLLLGCSI